MASQSLYRKWRSQTFAEVVGQESIMRTLKNALAENKLAHAYLFTGPRGTGKTTTARLLAKTINCLNLQNGEPCNNCLQCREITSGNSFNVVEIDAASNRGIDSIRELREKVMMPPAAGKYKVYILDEAHMLTTEAFNALLKTLEEPPPHAIFVMATTDVHKMLPTVLSRCQRFDFKRFTMRQIIEHLNHVAREEKITLESGAAELIARAAAGGMRDALSLLDQAIAYSGQTISLSQVQTMLGVADPRAIQKLITHVANLDSSAGLHLIHELAEAGADLRQLNLQVAEYWRAMMLSKAGANIAAILDSTEDEIREIAQTTQLFALPELTEYSRIFAQNDLMQKNQGTPQLGLELALLSCIALHGNARSGQSAAPSVAPSRPASPPEVSRRAVPPPFEPSTLPSRVDPIPPPFEPSTTFPPVGPAFLTVPATPEPPSSANEDLPGEEPTWNTLEPDAEEVVHEAAPIPFGGSYAPTPAVESVGASNGGSAPTLTVQDVKEKWEYVKRRVKTKKDGAKIAALLNGGYTVVAVEGSAELPIVMIKANAEFHYKAIFQRTDYHEIIEWALKVELQQECKVRLLPPGYTNGLNGAILPPPAPPSGNRSINTTIPGTSQPSAYRERPSSPTPTPPNTSLKESMANQVPGQPRMLHQSTPTAGANSHMENSAPPVANNVLPLARTGIVRENTTNVSSSSPRSRGSAGEIVNFPVTGETRQALMRAKYEDHQVVQKVAAMFKANVKDVLL
ncbi:MAG TPA: DNA polymerase III subunit gamma/tau [Ktedonosporobacter sp.]|nr:DNA polymerase III subunit gamma/tau [Ktedonosporobacter sp.]